MQRAEDQLRASGVTVSELQLPTEFDRLIDAHKLIMRAEGRSAFLAEYRRHPVQLGAGFREQVENIDGYTRAQMCAAYDAAASGRALFDQLCADYDAVLTPSTVGIAPLGLAKTGDYVFNGLWTLLHVPCVNVPAIDEASGLPIGLTLTGPRFRSAG